MSRVYKLWTWQPKSTRLRIFDASAYAEATADKTVR